MRKPILPIALAACCVMYGLDAAQAIDAAQVAKLARMMSREDVARILGLGEEAARHATLNGMTRIARSQGTVEPALPEKLAIIIEGLPPSGSTSDKVGTATLTAIQSAMCNTILDVMHGEPVPTKEEFLLNVGLWYIPSKAVDVAEELVMLQQAQMEGTLHPNDFRLSFMKVRYCP